MLQLDDLVVDRPGFRLGPVSLAVEAGQILALVGANGSGKTTLVAATLGQAATSSGWMFLDGAVVDLDRRDHLARVGYVPDEELTAHETLTALEHWRLVARVRDGAGAQESLRRAHRIAERLELDPGRRLIGAFSHGMRKKTQVVAALMHRPRLLLVDELRNGLDPISIHTTEELVDEARADGACVVVATHDLHWADRRADRVAVLHRGRLVASGTLPEVREAGESDLESTYLRLVR